MEIGGFFLLVLLIYLGYEKIKAKKMIKKLKDQLKYEKAQVFTAVSYEVFPELAQAIEEKIMERVIQDMSKVLQPDILEHLIHVASKYPDMPRSNLFVAWAKESHVIRVQYRFPEKRVDYNINFMG